jgi:hypothetical protein
MCTRVAGTARLAADVLSHIFPKPWFIDGLVGRIRHRSRLTRRTSKGLSDETSVDQPSAADASSETADNVV